jgi:hypothetical protein
MDTDKETRKIVQAATCLLYAGKDLVPVRPEYSNEDIVDQICYMLTFGGKNSVLEIGYESVPEILKLTMVRMLENAMGMDE